MFHLFQGTNFISPDTRLLDRSPRPDCYLASLQPVDMLIYLNHH